MALDKNRIRTQEEADEPAPMDQVEDRVEAKMKRIEGEAKEAVAHGLQDENLEREAQRIKQEADRELNKNQTADATKEDRS